MFAGIVDKDAQQVASASVRIPVNLQRPSSDHDVNDAIEKTMKSLAELDVSGNSTSSAFSEADAENQTNAERIQNVQRVNAFHDYCAVQNDAENMDGQMAEVEQWRNEDEDDGGNANHDDQWKALWDEHYQEMYWYNYSKYQEYIPTEEGWVPRPHPVADNQEVHGAEIDNNDCDEQIEQTTEETGTLPNETVEADDVGDDDDEDNNEPSDGGGGKKRKRGKKTSNQTGKGSYTLSDSEISTQ